MSRYLLAEKAFSEVKIFEQRAKVGGLWNYSPAFDNYPDRDRIPQTNPHAELDKPIWSDGSADGVENHNENGLPIYMSPIYDNLETNIPRECTYTNKPKGVRCHMD